MKTWLKSQNVIRPVRLLQAARQGTHPVPVTMDWAHISAVLDLAPAKSDGCALLLIFLFPFFHAFEKIPPKISLWIHRTTPWHAQINSWSTNPLLCKRITDPELVIGPAQKFLRQNEPNNHDRENRKLVIIPRFGYIDDRHLMSAMVCIIFCQAL